jgi:hypothetical protein
MIGNHIKDPSPLQILMNLDFKYGNEQVMKSASKWMGWKGYLL